MVSSAPDGFLFDQVNLRTDVVGQMKVACGWKFCAILREHTHELNNNL